MFVHYGCIITHNIPKRAQYLGRVITIVANNAIREEEAGDVLSGGVVSNKPDISEELTEDDETDPDN